MPVTSNIWIKTWECASLSGIKFLVPSREDPNIPVKYGIYPKMPDNRPDTVLFYEWRKSGKILSSQD
jgi:hypothetical protein